MVLRKNPAYNLKIMFDEEKINGYKIPYNCKDFNIPIDEFLELEKIWKDDQDSQFNDYDKFYEEFKK